MGRQHSFGDRKQLRVEDRLAQLLHELELEAAEFEERRSAKEREQQERERQWQAAMETATRRAIDAHRLELLRSRIQAWNEAEAIRAYCDAVEARHRDTIAEDEDEDAGAWLGLARQHADRLQALPRMPADPEPTPEQLKPYLGKWSPYGPHY